MEPRAPPPPSNGEPDGFLASDSFYKRSLDMARKQNKKLRAQLELIETENRDLKKSLYDLSYDYNRLRQQLDHDAAPAFDVSSALANQSRSRAPTDDLADVSVYFSRTLQCKSTLKAHRGAVYAVKFSPCGKMLATGAFDGTTRIWDVDSAGQRVPLCFDDHQRNVSCVEWSSDSSRVLSASYDGSLRVWDVAAERVVASFSAGAAIQDVGLGADQTSIYACTSNASTAIVCLDVRAPPTPSRCFRHSTLVNSLYVYRNSKLLLCGDHDGSISAWSTEDGRLISQVATDATKWPISHVCTSRPQKHDAEGSYLAAMSYDNVLRVYDRESFLVQRQHQSHNMHSQLTLVHELRSHVSRSWPIRSAFFQGRSYQGHAAWTSDALEEDAKDSLDRALLVACGSADANVYVYDVSGPKGSAQLGQRLEGHRDRVNVVDFHPREPVLASGSADFTIKVWAPK